jgi:uncharacterized protein (TIGR02001 family)
MPMRFSALTLLIFQIIPQFAGAQDASWSGMIGAASDYLWRGRSESRHRPVYQGQFDVWQGDSYAGIWLSRVDFNDRVTAIEIDPYVGSAWDLGEVKLIYGLGASFYPVQPAHDDDNDVEVKLGLAKSWEQTSLSLTANERIDTKTRGGHFSAHLGASQYYEAAGSYQIDPKWKASLALGFYFLEKGSLNDCADGARPIKDYRQGTLSLQYAVTETLALALTYAATDRAKINSSYHPALALSAKVTL